MHQTEEAASRAFSDALAAAEPPADWPAPLRALFLAGKGDWGGAHELVQHGEDRASAWVHAHLHRAEGDGWNARYWYRRAGQPEGEGDLPAERLTIAGALMVRGGI